MLTIFAKLSKRYRLSLSLKLKTREGRNLASKLLIPIFQNTKIKAFLGSNLAFAIMATSVLPAQGAFQLADNSLLIENEVLETSFAPSEYVIKVGKTEIRTKKAIQPPVEGVRLTQGYRLFHPGVDLAGKKGSPVKSIMPGIVEHTQTSRYDYGNAVIVNHGNGITSLYAHLSKINVEVGQEVGEDTVLGELGSTGHSTGPHLHLEIRNGNLPLNPLVVIPELKTIKTAILTPRSQ